jgi:hypothetical protein
MRVKNKLKIAGGVTGFMLAVGLAILLLNSKSIRLSQQDQVYLHRFLNDWHINESPEMVHKSFGSELNFISIIQDRVLANITGEQIPHIYFGNVGYYYQKRQGICYDRAILLEKFLLLYKFRFRHVYIYFGDDKKPSKRDFFKKGIKSHAALEVKTKKGWMAMGTDANWLGIGKHQELLTFYNLREELNKSKGEPRLGKPGNIGITVWKIRGNYYRFVYGVFSRHGDFFEGGSDTTSTALFTGKRHFLPDYNFKMLLYNF